MVSFTRVLPALMSLLTSNPTTYVSVIDNKWMMYLFSVFFDFISRQGIVFPRNHIGDMFCKLSSVHPSQSSEGTWTLNSFSNFDCPCFVTAVVSGSDTLR